jgi:hypothetical protein
MNRQNTLTMGKTKSVLPVRRVSMCRELQDEIPDDELAILYYVANLILLG